MSGVEITEKIVKLIMSGYEADKQRQHLER
jgi:hypothetical protein